ncbi:MAG TPA: hypothetical protein PKV71_10290 [Calditrichia bacterium]|nr:hypothetical protein [Calditrichia bacterium]
MLLITGLLTALLFADAVIMEFSGEPSRDAIELRWRTGTESDISIFMLERSTDGQNFSLVGQVPPKGDNSSYEYTDTHLNDTQSVYYYRLKIRNQNNTFQISEPISVIPNISSFAKTWGSIKALFQ